MPKGYFLSEVDVANATAYEAYRTRVLPTVEKFSGRFLVRGGEPKAIEGGGFASRVIISYAVVFGRFRGRADTAGPAAASTRSRMTLAV
jgi:uncharacterized protein (DUF1330 family)